MHTFDTPSPISAVLDVPAGRVQIIGADRADTVVEVLPADASKGRDVKAAQQTEVDYRDGVLRIEAPSTGRSGSVEVTIRLPAGSKVEGKADATEFRAIGRLGDVAFYGAYRHIAVDDAASLRLTATDGDVEVGRLGGPAEIKTQRGDIRVAEAAGGKVVLRTRSGDISLAAATGVSSCLDAGTAHGRITNALRNDGTAGLDIHATTDHGDIAARSL